MPTINDTSVPDARFSATVPTVNFLRRLLHADRQLPPTARKTAAAAVQLGSGEVWKAQLAGSSQAAIEWLQTLPGELRVVYEAGPTGFRLARAGRAVAIEVMVCSPGAIPRQPGDRIKTDTRDALKLARLHAA